jgi:hypothetical protein
MGKYEPLPAFLGRSDRTVQRLSFSEIERILGFKLPQSAYQHAAWWSNTASGHSHAQSWLHAGWQTEAIDLTGRKVTFRRAEKDRATAKQNPWGCMAGSVTLLPGVDLTAPTGETWNAEEGRLVND